jgi:ribonuclease M5
MATEKPRLKELVVVEGLHDAQAVREAVLADVWVVGGDRVAKRFLLELERAARGRGVIVLTDPDGPGERIRQRIVKAIPAAKQAFISKSLALGKGKVGVEHAMPGVIRAALMAAKATVVSELVALEFTTDDLMQAGLIGSIGAAEKRRQVGDILNIGTGNAKTFLNKLNGLGITRNEWLRAVGKVESKDQRRQ